MRAHSTDLGRLHYFDALRAFAMLLGIVWHAAVTYYFLTGPALWATSTDNRVLGWWVTFSHTFRLPAFFLMAGFFGALTRSKTTAAAFARTRFTRIVIPLAVAVCTISPLIVLATRAWSGAEGQSTGPIMAFRLYHLWFLYYLALMYVLVLAIEHVRGFLPSRPRVVDRVLEAHIAWRGRLVVLSAIGALACWVIDSWPQANPGSTWVVQVPLFVYYLWFFVVGWLLFGRQHLLDATTRAPWLHLAVAVGASVVVAVVGDPGLVAPSELTRDILLVLTPLVAWSAVFGLIGLFARWLRTPAPAVRYLADASYWLYIIHLPIVILLTRLATQLEAVILLELAAVLIVTFVVGLITYEVAVRYTWVGRTLHGPRTRTSAAAPTTAEVAFTQ